MPLDTSEILDPPRRRTFDYYIVLLVLVAPVWCCVPFSWAFVAYALKSGVVWSFGWQGKTTFAVALCEVVFSLHYAWLARRVSGPSPIGPGPLPELQAAYTRVLKAGMASLPEDGFDEESLDVDRPGSPGEDILQLHQDDERAIEFRSALRTWFGGVPWSQICRHQVYEWLYWSTFNAPLPSREDMPHAHKVALDDGLELLEKRSGTKIPEGSNPAATPMRLTLDVVKIAHRPMLFYAFVAVVNRSLRLYYASRFKVLFGDHEGLEYMLYHPEQWDAKTDPRPLVVMHGLGLGLLQYHLFFKHLFQSVGDRPILIPLQPSISQDLFHPRFLAPMGRHELADKLISLMGELGWVAKISEADPDIGVSDEYRGLGVTILSHSNGSYLHAWMLKSAHAHTITKSCFVDPVTFCSWEGHVCYNFVYRPCATGIELVMRYFVGTELGVANLLQRHFDWSSNALWFEEIPNARDPSKTRFFVGGKDDIINAERVKRYLTSHGVRKGLTYDPHGRHGQALMIGGQSHREILQFLKEK